MTKEEFLNKLAKAASLSYTTSDLLRASVTDHFDSSAAAVLEDRSEAGDGIGAAFWWINDHYNSAAAMVNAANQLTEVLLEIIIDLDESAKGVVQPAG